MLVAHALTLLEKKMVKPSVKITAFACLLSLPMTSQAELVYREFSQCRGNGSVCAPKILAQGEFSLGDGPRLVAFLSSRYPDRIRELNGKEICFDSQGGDLMSAIHMGKNIRTLGLSTCLMSEYEHVYGDAWKVTGATCEDECIWAFLGGVERSIENTQEVVLSVGPFDQGSYESIGTAIFDAGRYLDQIGVSRYFLDTALTAPASGASLYPSKRLELGIEYRPSGPEAANWELIQQPDGSIIARVDQYVPGNRSIFRLGLYKLDSGPEAVLAVLPHPNGADYQRLNSAYSLQPDVKLTVNGRAQDYQNQQWTVNSSGAFTLITLPPIFTSAPNFIETIEVDVDLPEAYRDVRPRNSYYIPDGDTRLSAIFK